MDTNQKDTLDNKIQKMETEIKKLKETDDGTYLTTRKIRAIENELRHLEKKRDDIKDKEDNHIYCFLRFLFLKSKNSLNEIERREYIYLEQKSVKSSTPKEGSFSSLRLVRTNQRYPLTDQLEALPDNITIIAKIKKLEEQLNLDTNGKKEHEALSYYVGSDIFKIKNVITEIKEYSDNVVMIDSIQLLDSVFTEITCQLISISDSQFILYYHEKINSILSKLINRISDNSKITFNLNTDERETVRNIEENLEKLKRKYLISAEFDIKMNTDNDEQMAEDISQNINSKLMESDHDIAKKLQDDMNQPIGRPVENIFNRNNEYQRRYFNQSFRVGDYFSPDSHNSWDNSHLVPPIFNPQMDLPNQDSLSEDHESDSFILDEFDTDNIVPTGLVMDHHLSTNYTPHFSPIDEGQIDDFISDDMVDETILKKFT